MSNVIYLRNTPQRMFLASESERLEYNRKAKGRALNWTDVLGMLCWMSALATGAGIGLLVF